MPGASAEVHFAEPVGMLEKLGSIPELVSEGW